VSCTIEDFYECSGGSSTGPDVCTLSAPSLSYITVSENNNLYVYFDREMTAVSDVLDTSFSIEIVDSSDKQITDFSWKVPEVYYDQYKSSTSAKFIFIALDIKETIEGGSNAATVKVTYNFDSGTGIFKDTLNQFLANQTNIEAKLHSKHSSLSGIEEIAVTVIGIITAIIVATGKVKLIDL